MKIKFKKYWRKTSLKNKEDGHFFLNHIKKKKTEKFPRNWRIPWCNIQKCL